MVQELQKQMKFLRQRVDQNQDRLEQTTARVDYLETAVEEDREKASLSSTLPERRLFESQSSVQSEISSNRGQIDPPKIMICATKYIF
jgi:flagellar biosynthesis chaperone FliJ